MLDGDDIFSFVWDISQRQLCIDDRQSYKALASPFPKIPFEIWTQIFAWSMAGDDVDDLWLTQVCVRWRDILISAPFLWQKIRIESDEEKSDFVRSLIRSRKCYCGDIPLHVEIFIPEAPEVNAEDSEDEEAAEERYEAESRIPALRRLLKEILSLVKPTMSKLHLSRFQEVWLDAVAPIRLGSMQLNSFAITTDPDGTDEKDSNTAYTKVLDFLSVAPNLRHLTISNFNFADGSDPSAAMASLWDQSAYRTAPGAPNLTSITFDEMPLGSRKDAQFTPLSSSLIHMSIPEWSVRSAVSPLSIPSLKSVHILGDGMSEALKAISAAPLAPFILRSAYSLHILQLDEVLLNDDTFLEILCSVPHLQTFNFTPFTGWSPLAPRWHISNQAYRKMSLDESAFLAPHLKSLMISIHPHARHEILDMIMSRQGAYCEATLVSPLRSCYELPSEAISSFSEKVKHIRARGMRLFARVDRDDE
ncbi:hypothetical protein C8J56DRAFT_1174031 [Mycena floridula]|nr:hypothetical protein C8J56DRAFT_1174031 [Mycena floridula]